MTGFLAWVSKPYLLRMALRKTESGAFAIPWSWKILTVLTCLIGMAEPDSCSRYALACRLP